MEFDGFSHHIWRSMDPHTIYGDWWILTAYMEFDGSSHHIWRYTINQPKSDLSYPHTSVLGEFADKVRELDKWECCIARTFLCLTACIVLTFNIDAIGSLNLVHPLVSSSTFNHSIVSAPDITNGGKADLGNPIPSWSVLGYHRTYVALGVLACKGRFASSCWRSRNFLDVSWTN